VFYDNRNAGKQAGSQQYPFIRLLPSPKMLELFEPWEAWLMREQIGRKTPFRQ
jgi:hypothetical protein